MKHPGKLLFIFILFLFGCSAGSLKSTEKNEFLGKTNSWGDWTTFPIQQLNEGVTVVRNDFLMYRIQKEGFNKEYSAFKYKVQFRNNRDELVKIKYNMFTKFEICDDLELLIGPNKKSQTVIHLFDQNAQLFLQLKNYSEVINSEYLLGKAD